MKTLPIANKIAKLVPRLSSNHQGEVVATVAAIGRLLKAASLDWHDLAAVIAETQAAEPPAFSSLDYAAMAQWCINHGRDRLSQRELQFCFEMSIHLSVFKTPTPKQAGWLDAIFAKLSLQNWGAA